MTPDLKLEVIFFKTFSGSEPVKEWLKKLSPTDKKIVGSDIRTLQIAWPLGMPLVRKIATKLWEIRSIIASGIVRIFFTIIGNTLFLLHAFTKKTQKTPLNELTIAKERLKQLQRSRHEQYH